MALTKVLQVRLSASFYDKIATLAKREGLDKSAYARRILTLYAVPTPTPTLDDATRKQLASLLAEARERYTEEE